MGLRSGFASSFMPQVTHRSGSIDRIREDEGNSLVTTGEKKAGGKLY